MFGFTFLSVSSSFCKSSCSLAAILLRLSGEVRIGFPGIFINQAEEFKKQKNQTAFSSVRLVLVLLVERVLRLLVVRVRKLLKANMWLTGREFKLVFAPNLFSKFDCNCNTKNLGKIMKKCISKYFYLKMRIFVFFKTWPKLTSIILLTTTKPATQLGYAKLELHGYPYYCSRSLRASNVCIKPNTWLCV